MPQKTLPAPEARSLVFNGKQYPVDVSNSCTVPREDVETALVGDLPSGLDLELETYVVPQAQFQPDNSYFKVDLTVEDRPERQMLVEIEMIFYRAGWVSPIDIDIYTLTMERLTRGRSSDPAWDYTTECERHHVFVKFKISTHSKAKTVGEILEAFDDHLQEILSPIDALAIKLQEELSQLRLDV